MARFCFFPPSLITNPKHRHGLMIIYKKARFAAILETLIISIRFSPLDKRVAGEKKTRNVKLKSRVFLQTFLALRPALVTFSYDFRERTFVSFWE